jgi:hypothetical protein
MSIKRQPKLEINWDVVRDVLGVAWNCRGTEGFPNLTEGETIMRLASKSNDREHYAQWLASVGYALDESLVSKFRYEGDKTARLNGLTTKGFELLNILDNEWVWGEIRSWASEKDVPLTADIIIKAGERIILSSLDELCPLRDNVRSYCV